MNEYPNLNKKPSLRGILSPLLNNGGTLSSPSRYDEQRGNLHSRGGSRGNSRESLKSNTRGGSIQIKEDGLKSTLAQNITNHKKQMDINIASNKFANQQSLVC